MGHEFRLTSHWAHWTFGVLAAASFLDFGWMVLGGNRILTPAYLLGSYWLLAAIVNRKTIASNPTGLHVTVSPIRVRPALHLTRGQIRCCYIRYVINVDEGGVEGQRFYMAAIANAGEHNHLIPVESRDQFPFVPAANKLRILTARYRKELSAVCRRNTSKVDVK